MHRLFGAFTALLWIGLMGAMGACSPAPSTVALSPTVRSTETSTREPASSVSPTPVLGNQPPVIVASYAGQEQRGKLGSYCWNGGCGDIALLIPAQPITVPPAAKIQFAIGEPVAPHQLFVTLFPVDRSEQVAWSDPNFLALNGRGELARAFPRPATQFEYQMPDRMGDYALSLLGEWQTGPSSGPDASYGFHIVVGNAPSDTTPVVTLPTVHATATTPEGRIAPTSTPTVTTTPAALPSVNPYGTVSRIASPDGKWTAVLDTRVGSLDLQRADGNPFTVFAPGSTAQTVSWSPDSRKLLIVRTNYLPTTPGTGVVSTGPIEIWQVRADQPGTPMRLFQSELRALAPNVFAPGQIEFGHWSPNSRYFVFWLGELMDNADGMAPWVLNVETSKATQLADIALDNLRYQSWAPDGSTLVFTAGGYRSAQVNKWLDLFDVATGQVTTVISQTEAIPGIVAWSPRGDWIAYAAVLASDTGSGLADWMSFENTAILKRRVYLLDPKTREHHRLNQVDAFQDAPVWSDDGATLYYAQRDGNDMVLMTANPATGQAQIVEGSRRPAPTGVGYYGQSNWDDLLSYRRAASNPPIPPLTQIYTDSASGFTLRYPSDWSIGKGWETLLYRCDECVTISSDVSVANSSDLTSFSGRAFISIELVTNPELNLDALLARALLNPGPGQYVGFRAPLSTFDKRTMTIDGQSAMRVETMDELGTTNHVLIVTDIKRAVVVRGRGDGRVFDAMVATLKSP